MFIGYYNIANLVTLLGLVSSVLACFNAMNGNIKMGVVMFLLAGLCDMFDGRVARTKKNRTAEQKGFGIQIDSLCDIVAFGILPAVITIVVCGSVWYAVLIAALYVLAGLIRLAYFNVTEELRQQETDECRKTYTGLPITSAALIFPFFFCFLDIFQRAAILHGALLVVMALTGASFVMPFHIRKPRSKEQWALLGIGLVIAAGCIFVWVRFRMRIVR